MKRQGGCAPGHMGPGQRIECHRFEGRELVVARRTRNGHKFEGSASRFAPGCDGDVVFHFSVKDFKLRRPRELRFAHKFEVAVALEGDFNGDGFVGGDAVGGDGLVDPQVGKSAK